MAKPPVTVEKPAEMADEDQPDAMIPSGGDAAGGEEDGDGKTVLLTVCKEADGTYRLIPGDEPEPEEGDDGEASGEDMGKTYDSIGSLLKAILDMLNAKAGDEGTDEASGEDEFQKGFGADAAAGAAGGAPMAQKY